MIMGEVQLVNGLIYILAQIVAAILGSFTNLLYNDLADNSVFFPFRYSSNDYNPWKACFLIVLTSFVMMYIYACIQSHRKRSPEYLAVMVGGALATLYITFRRYGSLAINPLHSLGGMAVTLRLFSVEDIVTNQNWIYLVIPFLGTVLGAVLYKFVIMANFEKEEGDDKDGQEPDPSELL